MTNNQSLPKGVTFQVRTSTTHVSHSCSLIETFDVNGISVHGGASLLVDFARGKLQLPHRLESLPSKKASWATYSVAQDAADVTSFTSVNQPLLSNLLVPETQAILDIDTTVETVHGGQEGSCVAYNPRYSGRASYQPLLAFKGRTGACIYGELRSGKAPDVEEKLAFYRSAKAQLPKGVTLGYVRADKAFPSDEFCAELENDHVGDTLKLRMTSRLWERISRDVLWHRIPSDETTAIGVGLSAFEHTACGTTNLSTRKMDALFNTAYHPFCKLIWVTIE